MSYKIQVGFIHARNRMCLCTTECEKQLLANQIVIFTVECFVLFYNNIFVCHTHSCLAPSHGFREESKTPGFRSLKARRELQERLSHYQKRSLRCHLLHGVCRFFFPPLLIPFFFPSCIFFFEDISNVNRFCSVCLVRRCRESRSYKLIVRFWSLF
jgi:hypothetical protein